MCIVLKYRKIFKNGSVRLRYGCVCFFNLLKFSTVLVESRIYKLHKTDSVDLKRKHYMEGISDALCIIAQDRASYYRLHYNPNNNIHSNLSVLNEKTK